MRKGFIVSLVLGLIILLCPINVHAMGGNPRNVNDSYDYVYGLIKKQSHSKLTQNQIDEFYNYFMRESPWRPQQVFPYPNARGQVHNISDGKYNFDVDAQGCYAYSKFLRGVMYGCSQNKSRPIKTDGFNRATWIKDLILHKAQFGEQIVTENLHSVSFLACDEDGFYGLEFWENDSCVHFVYYSYQSFAEQAESRNVWIWDEEPAENVVNPPEISNPRVTNLTKDGFDITFDVKNGARFTDLKCRCELNMYVNRNEVSWGNIYPVDDIPIWSDKSTYKGSTASVSFTFVDELTTVFSFDEENDRWIGMISSTRGEVPRSGIERGPYLLTAQLEFKVPSENEIRTMVLDYSKNPLLLDITSQQENPIENQETIETDNGGNTKPDSSPVGENVDESSFHSNGSSTGFDNPKRQRSVNGPIKREVGYVFNDAAGMHYRVSGDQEVYVTGIPVKNKKVRIAEVITVDGFTYKVKGISSDAFKKDKKITELIIGENVEVIGKAAFQGCKNLKTIKIKARNLKKTYRNSFDGTNKNMKVWIRYKNRLKKYKKLVAKSGVSKSTTYAYKKFN